jgi:hypothetical protein
MQAHGAESYARLSFQTLNPKLLMQAHGVGNEHSAMMMMEMARSLTRSEAFEEVRSPKP